MEKKVIELYAEKTPNPNSIKLVVNYLLVEGDSLEFSSPEKAKDVPLASKLFQFPFITGVFIANNYITVSKRAEIDWYDVLPELRTFVKDYLENGNPVLAKKIITDKGELVERVSDKKPELVSEIDMKINAILEEYIRPAVEQDGGAITFRSFKDGIVTVALQGACSGCPSSRITLKSGIEGLLKRMIPEVQSVEAEEI